MLVYIKKKKRHTWALSRRCHRPVVHYVDYDPYYKKKMLVFFLKKKNEEKEKKNHLWRKRWRLVTSFGHLLVVVAVLSRLT
jgi:hypothetical protein